MNITDIKNLLALSLHETYQKHYNKIFQAVMLILI